MHVLFPRVHLFIIFWITLTFTVFNQGTTHIPFRIFIVFNESDFMINCVNPLARQYARPLSITLISDSVATQSFNFWLHHNKISIWVFDTMFYFLIEELFLWMLTRISRIAYKNYLCFVFRIKILFNYYSFQKEYVTRQRLSSLSTDIIWNKSNFNMQLMEIYSKNKNIDDGEINDFIFENYS